MRSFDRGIERKEKRMRGGEEKEERRERRKEAEHSRSS